MSRSFLVVPALLALAVGCGGPRPPASTPAPQRPVAAANPDVTGTQPAPRPTVAAAPATNRQFVGEWGGTLKVPAGSLRLLVKIAEAPDGALRATVVSIDQGGAAIPVTRAVATGARLGLDLKTIAASFDGVLQAGAGPPTIAGTWTQGGARLPLTLRRGKPAEPKRPQEPRKPYPYREEEVTYENAKAGARFAATLTLPAGRGPFPAVLLISGSGPQDRDETVFGHRPFLVLADYLTRRGIATLRADDRGVGGSTGDRTRATTADFVDDALAGVQYLKTRPDIDRRRIGLVGHSEGGTIAPMAATRSKDVAFIVMLAGTGLPGEEVLYLQGWRLLQARGAAREAVQLERTIQEGAFAIVKQEQDDATAEKRIRELCATSAKALGKEQVAALVKQITSPWMRFFITFDPRPTLRKVRCPVLVLNGEKDTQVTPKENVPAVEAALRGGGNRKVTVRVLPGLNHLFQTCQTGVVTEYAQIEETFSPVALEAIGDWLVTQARVRR